MSEYRVTEDDLHAYVDGHLDAGRRLAVERWLAEDPEAAARAEDYRAQSALLHEMFDSVLREPAPVAVDALAGRLSGRLAGNDNSPPWYTRPWMRAAAAVVLLVTGVAGGYLGRGAVTPTPAMVEKEKGRSLQLFAEEATQAHRFYTSDERFQVEMGADDRGALDSFLSQRVGRDIFGPDLGRIGYRLIGGRSLPTDTGAGAQYMYINDQGKRITLFVGNPVSGAETSFRFAQNGDVAAFYWVEGSTAYALIGRLSKDELQNISTAVYDEVKSGRSKRQSQQQPPADNQQQHSNEGPPQDTMNPVQPVSDTRNKES